jgi:AraC-like DNA-binding protein
MALETGDNTVNPGSGQLTVFRQKFHNSISKTLRNFEAKIVKQDNNNYLVMFKTATNAVLCALKIQSDIKYITPKFDRKGRDLKIGIRTGTPLDQELGNSKVLIAAVLDLCEFELQDIVITSAVKGLYEEENRNARIDTDYIRSLTRGEEEMLMNLLEKANTLWNTPKFTVGNLSRQLGLSPSQFRRKLKRLTGKTPNIFIREFRLKRALTLMNRHFGKISQVASESGFKSPSYFTRCFRSTFGILPSKYTQLLKA